MYKNPDASIVTAVTPISATGELDNPNCVKALLAPNGQALDFSRSPFTGSAPLRHLGLYLYQRHALEQFTKLPPSGREQSERLEQLRAVEAGITIHAIHVEKAPVGVDTPEDLETLRALFK